NQLCPEASIWSDTVKWGEMLRQVRGLGEIKNRQPVTLRIAETQVKDVKAGREVSIDTGNEALAAMSRERSEVASARYRRCVGSSGRKHGGARGKNRLEVESCRSSIGSSRSMLKRNIRF